MLAPIYRHFMANVLPNLEDLLDALPDDAAGADAAALAHAAAAAGSWPAATTEIVNLVRTWMVS